jgi:hypothetical protein
VGRPIFFRKRRFQEGNQDQEVKQASAPSCPLCATSSLSLLDGGTRAIRKDQTLHAVRRAERSPGGSSARRSRPSLTGGACVGPSSAAARDRRQSEQTAEGLFRADYAAIRGTLLSTRPLRGAAIAFPSIAPFLACPRTGLRLKYKHVRERTLRPRWIRHLQGLPRRFVAVGVCFPQRVL